MNASLADLTKILLGMGANVTSSVSKKTDIVIAGENAEFLVTNLAETRKFNIQTPDVVVKVNPERADLVETKIIDGKQCLVIEINDQVEVNGVPIRTISKEEN